MNQDYYEILQVHPRADQDAIAAAYTRLRDRYDPARLDGAADEFAELAREKRDAIERAYAVLADSARRAAYDAELAARSNGAAHEALAASSGLSRDGGTAQQPAGKSTILDYRPLPPARRAERVRGFDIHPVQVILGRQPTQPHTRPRIALVVVLGLLALVIAISVAITNGGPSPASTAATTPGVPVVSPLDQFEALISETQRATEQNPQDARSWINYGDTLYNSVEIVRENAPDSPLYSQRLSRWLLATEAYTRALALDPGNFGTRADLGASACFYGAGIGDQRFVRSGISETRRAAQAAPDDPRVLLSLGHCLASAQPPQTKEAVENWKRVVLIAPPDSPLAAQAQMLIAKYGP